MAAKAGLRFDPDRLRELAGGKTFARGEDYCRDGRVEIVSLTARRVVAQVAGTEDYHTVVTGRGSAIDGECSCPAFEDLGFCKHMVATALAANDGSAGTEAKAADASARIRKYLKSKGVDRLVDMVLELAEDDPELLRKLDMDSALAQADDKTLEASLRKAIGAATRTGTYIDYRQAPRWQARIDATLDAVADLASGPRAEIALRLVEHAMDRIEQASGSIDDSDGILGALHFRAGEIHLAAAHMVRPDPVALARDLFKRETKSDFDTFAGGSITYADILGGTGLAEYKRLAMVAWEDLRSMPDPTHFTIEFQLDQLTGILDSFAERDGDVEARIALRLNDLSSPWRYLELARLCLSQGRETQALQYAEEGLWLFEDRQPDEALLFFAVKLLENAGRKADAEAHLERAFGKAPSLELYKQIGSSAGRPAAARALASLEAGLASAKNRRDHADLLVNILIYEKKFDAAWSAARRPGVSEYTREALVEACETKFPNEAIEFYAAQIEQLAVAGLYAEAVKRIARMAKLRSPAEQADFVADVKLRHRRKRSFMKLLG
ncbi:acyltransferase [Mesorhizobium sp. B2-3-5]|nr:acyltransferase [Mesorhizobium sp. B2-3-5]